MSCREPQPPVATYRVQMTAEFGFDHAAAIADYLARLGVSHLYTSPILQAGKGSAHGYDVVSHKRLNTELGGADAYTRLCDALARHGLSQLLDIVPNHMATTGGENDLWWDVLENGRSSRFAAWFDVDWNPPDPGLRDRVLLAILGDHYGRILAARGFALARDKAAFTVQYGDHRSPASPESLCSVLCAAADRAGSDRLRLLSAALERLPSGGEPRLARIRHRDKGVVLGLLERLFTEEPETAAAVDSEIADINADPDRMDSFLERQHYRLAYWRVAGTDLNYRRFFNINTLVGLRVEVDEVFDETHVVVLEAIHDGCVTGLRVDHIDGLRDPVAYLRHLRYAAPGAYVIVEKILEPGEWLADWPVSGTTGYDFLNKVAALFVDPMAISPFTALYSDFTGEPSDWLEIVRQKKHKMVYESFSGESDRLTALLVAIAESSPCCRDYSRRELGEVLREYLACYPVYRTYVRPATGEVSVADARYIHEAIASAKRNRPKLDHSFFDFLGDLLLLRLRGPLEADFVERFQQLTGAVMAKGVEDTGFYVFNRLAALNEVGGDPGHFGISLVDFHTYCAEVQARWPETLLATATHDTKRGEDTRLRISMLTECPDAWSNAVRRWTEMTRRHCSPGYPDRNAEYLFYQTLVGAWPVTPERMAAYMLKAAHEAKTYTPWIDPNPEYEAALKRFVEGSLADGEFIADVERFIAPLVYPSRVSSLSQTLIKYTAPGVPDQYQGTELWDHSLVDPDNRRCVDYRLRERLLGELDGVSPEEVLARMEEGLPKLFVVKCALDVRRSRLECFRAGSAYIPMYAQGAKADHVVAFGRGRGEGTSPDAAEVITIAPRLVLSLDGDWADTAIELPARPLSNAFTGETLPGGHTRLVDLFARFPVALLVAV